MKKFQSYLKKNLVESIFVRLEFSHGALPELIRLYSSENTFSGILLEELIRLNVDIISISVDINNRPYILVSYE